MDPRNKQVHRVAAVGLLLLLGTCAMTQPWRVPVTPGKGDISEAAARSRAVAFALAAGVAPPRSDVPGRLVQDTYDGKLWEFYRPDDYSFEVHAANGAIRSYGNKARIFAQVKGLMDRSRPPRLANAQIAKDYVWKLARALGLPKEAYLQKFSFNLDNEPGHGDANRTGSVSASFGVRVPGHPTVPGLQVMAIGVDPLDGALVGFADARGNAVVEAATVNIRREDAIRTAVRTYEAYWAAVKRPWRQIGSPNTAGVYLRFTHRNGQFDNKQYPWVLPSRVRLAWIVPFGKYDDKEVWWLHGIDEVWIDAGDGSVLGGLIMKSPPRNALKPASRPARRK